MAEAQNGRLGQQLKVQGFVGIARGQWFQVSSKTSRLVRCSITLVKWNTLLQ
jgi:hypothetical protein